MNSRQTFKAAFIAAAVEAGCNNTADVIKRAQDAVGIVKSGWIGQGPLGALVEFGANSLKDISLLGAAGLIALPVVGGAAAGTMLGHATDINDLDVSGAKSQEIVDAYKRKTDEINQLNKLRGVPARPVNSGGPALRF